MPQGEMIALTTSVVAVNEKLPSALGIFRSNEFLNLSSMVADGMAILEIWKNMLCSIGNINQLEVMGRVNESYYHVVKPLL